MILMDVESGSWVGDMFQRFETMCVGVEEALYEDTFKYVENQVWTVGETVKRFYSDVMQDLIPPSPSDSIKTEEPVSNAGHNESVINVENGSSCSPIISVIKPHKPVSNDFDLSDLSTSNTEDRECTKGSQESLSKLPNIYENIANNYNEEVKVETCSSSETLSPVNEDASSKEVLEVMHSEENGVEICTDLKKCDEGGDMEDDSDGRLSTDLGLNSTQAVLNTKITSNVENTIQVDKELSMFDIETSNSFQSPEFRLCEANEEVFRVERPNEANLEESCVLVGKNDIFSKPGRHMQRFYKKKIQDVFSTRRWSKGKRNQEQIAVWYEEKCGKNSVSTTLIESQLQKQQTIASFDSDWELL